MGLDCSGERFAVFHTFAYYDEAPRLFFHDESVRLAWGADLSHPFLVEERLYASLRTAQRPLVGFRHDSTEHAPFLSNVMDIRKKGIKVYICVDTQLLETLYLDTLKSRCLTEQDAEPWLRVLIGFRWSETHRIQIAGPRDERSIYFRVAPHSAQDPLGATVGQPSGTPEMDDSDSSSPRETRERADDRPPLIFSFVPVGEVMRDYDETPSIKLVRSRQAAETTNVKKSCEVRLDPDADLLFKREVLFGFSLVPPKTASPHAQLERILVIVQVPVALDPGQPSPFQIVELHRPNSSREAAVIQPCPRFNEVVEPRESRICRFETVLAVHVDYGFIFDLEVIGYRLGRLFDIHEPVSSTITIRFFHYDNDSARKILELAHVDIVLPATQKPKILICGKVEFAVVHSANSARNIAYRFIKRNNICNITLINICKYIINVEARIRSDPTTKNSKELPPGEGLNILFDSDHDTNCVVRMTSQEITTPWECELWLRVDLPLKHEVIAIDIGTASIALALGRYGSARSEMVALGSIVSRFAPDDLPRRERRHADLLPSACGLTNVGAQRRVPPLHAAKEFDFRHDAKAQYNDLAAAKARLRATGTRVDLHLPVWARKHERLDPMESGFLMLRSIKTQICTRAQLRFRDPSSGNVAILFAHGAEDEPGERPARAIDTASILHATLDMLLNPYLFQAYPQFVTPRDLVATTYVMTYPASISVEAQRRYREAAEGVVERKQRAMPQALTGRQRASVSLVSEAAAAAWALLETSSLRLWQTNDKVIKRLVLFDVGAGTLDVAAFDFAPGEHVAPILQTVSFSLPYGGDVMDEAIANDFELADKRFADGAPRNVLDRRDLLDHIDVGKRCGSGNLLLVPDKLEFEFGEERPGSNHEIWDIDTGEKVNSSKVCDGIESFPMVQWYLVDMSRFRYNTALYFDLIRRAIVPSTIDAADAGRLRNGLEADTAVVISGRASLFVPLQLAVKDGVTDKNTKVALATDIVATGDDEKADAAALMKGVAVRGAVAWARRNQAERLRMTSPWRAVQLFAAVFGVLRGRWDADDDGFGSIASIHNLTQGDNRFHFEPGKDVEPGQEDGLFLVMRPPHFTQPAVFTEHMKSRFGRSLVNRIIRPIIVEPGTPLVGAPHPVGSGLEVDAKNIRLAGPGQELSITYHEPVDNHVLLTIERDSELLFDSLQLASGFLDALGG